VYGLRHSFATFYSERGMDKEVLREIMGHSDFETTDFYYIYISEDRKQNEFHKANEGLMKTQTFTRYTKVKKRTLSFKKALKSA